MARSHQVITTVALALSLAACGGSSGSGGGGGTPTNPTPTPTPPPANRAPVVTNVTITPGFGIQDLSTFSLGATATDADGDPLTYAWEFGDGTTGTGPNVTKVYTTGGTKNVRLTVNDGKATASEFRTATATENRTADVGSMTGQWRLQTTACSGRSQTFTMTLTQVGGTITGSFSMPSGFCAAPSGSSGVTDPAEPGKIDQAGAVSIRFKVGRFLDFYFRGTMQAPGTTCTGGVHNSGFNGESTTLTKIG